MTNVEETKSISERIDKNDNWEFSQQEIKDFIFDKKNGQQNIKDLVNFLEESKQNRLDPYGKDKYFVDNFQNIMDGLEISEMFTKIDEKINKNENLTNDEKSLIYLDAITVGKRRKNTYDMSSGGIIHREIFLKNSKAPFNPNDPIRKICDGEFLNYIRCCYGNQNYNPEQYSPIPDKGSTIQDNKNYIKDPVKFKQEKEKEKIKSEYEGLPQIPPISQRGNEYIHSYCNKIYKRAEDNGYLMMAEYESRLKNEFRSHFSISEFKYVNDKEFDAYVKYDKMLFAFSKYCEVINKKHEQVIKEAGYHDVDEIAQEMKYFSQFQDLIKEKYPELEAIMKRLEPYWGEMEENKNKYFGGKTDEEIEKAGQNFKEFQEFQNKKSEEYGITDEMIKTLNITPNTKEEAEEYFKNLNKVLIYQNVLNEKKGEYGNTIDNYYGYMIGISEIQKRYSEADFDTIKNYSKDLQTRGQDINFERCRKYASLIDRTGKYGALGKDLENIGIIQEILMDPTNENFFILDVKNAEIAKKLRQERIDKTRDIIKTYAPQVYWSSTILAGFWNGLVDSTIGVGTSLGAMITGLIGGKEHYQSQLQKKERRDNFLKINQSSSQKEAVYDGKSLNFKRDNTISTVSGSIAQMLCLIYGGSAVGNGITKLGTKAGLTISEKVVSKAGLFGMSFITQVGQSYGEAINSGLDGTGAFAYSMLSASIQSGLELVSPNDVLLGKGTGLGKQLITSICKNEGGIKLVGKYFLKSVGREILEENLQEGLQLAAGNLVNDMVNGVRNTGLESDWNPKNFLSTAIITTLTTGITTGFSAGRQGLQMFKSSQPQLISRIASDPGLYEEVMGLIDNSIDGKFTIPNVKIEQLKDLRTTLEAIDAIQEQNDESQNTEPEDQENESSKQQTEDAESHDDKTEENVKTKKKRNQNYFDGQSHEFEVTQEQAIENSKYMDNALENVINETDEGKLQELLNDIKNRIEGQYEQTTGQKLDLSEDQVWSILDAHSEDGVLGKLTRTQLSKKVRPLTETIPDGNVRRFLLEAGFCGRWTDLMRGFFTNELTITNDRLKMESQANRIVKKQDLGNYNILLYVGRSEIQIEKTDNGYIITNLSNNESYLCEKGYEYIVGREGNIKIDESDKEASRQHLKIMIDSDGNIIFTDISTNGTEYKFVEKGKNDSNSGCDSDELILTGDEEIEEVKIYNIGDIVKIPRTDGRITRANVTAYDPEYGNYRVDWNENGRPYHKYLTQEELDKVNLEENESGIQEIGFSTEVQRMEQNVDLRVPQGNLDSHDILFKIGVKTELLLSRGSDGTYTVFNFESGEGYKCEPGSETTIGREGAIRIEGDGTISRKHLTIKVDNEGNLTIKDTSKNGTKYSFTEKAEELDISEAEVISNDNAEGGLEQFQQQENIRPERGINTERREMSEVYRNSDVIAIGDLHGEYEALKGNMEFVGLAKEVNGHLEWTGGNKKVVFQGDILADRGTDGLRIIQEIHQLRKQARKQGGDIDIIVGNHDDFMISFLTERGGVHGNGIEVANYYKAPGQGLGLTELAKFIGGKTGDFDIIRGQQKNILKAMRESPEGRLILEEICNMKIVTQIDDVLYCHTNPTPEMLRYLTNGNVQDNIDSINYAYQGYLRYVLLGEGKPTISLNQFNRISDIFLDTNNRNDRMRGIENYCQNLKNAGINMISHGHNGGYGYRSTEIGGIKIVDTDHTFMKGGNDYGQGHSVSIIKKEGGVNYLGDNAINSN